MRLGFLELVVILVIILLVVGPKQVPKLTAVLSDSIKSFKEGLAKKEDKVEEKTEA